MALRAERRTHHIAGGGLPIGVAVHAVVQQQMAGQHLAVHRLALGPGVGDLVQGFLGRDVHQIQRRTEGFGDADGAAGGFAFNLRGSRQRVCFRPGQALGQELLLQVIDQLAVLGVHGGHCAQFEAALEARHQGVVSGHDGVLVGHEVLEAVDPELRHQLAHLAADLLAPPGDGDVEAVVGRGLFRPAAPGMEGFEQGLLRIGNHEVDDRGGAAGQACGGAAEEVLAGHRAHEGQLHMGVRVDAAGHQVLAAAVEHLTASGGVEVVANGLDQAVCAQHIGAVALLMGDQGGATDQQRHGGFLAGRPMRVGSWLSGADEG